MMIESYDRGKCDLLYLSPFTTRGAHAFWWPAQTLRQPNMLIPRGLVDDLSIELA